VDNRDLIFLVFFFALVLAAFQLGMSAKGHGLMRVQHLSTAVDYARGHIDLLRPVIPGFNANNAPTPLDFPIWEGLTAACMKLFGLWYGWGNVVTLLFLFSSMWALFDLTRRCLSPRAAWWTVLFSLTQPLIVLRGGEAGADGTAWAFAVWFVYLAFRMLAGGGWRWWPAAALAGALSAATKAPFFFTAGLTTLLWLLKDYRRARVAWLQLASAGALSCAALCAWSAYCHRVYALAEFPLVNLSVFSAGGTKSWYLGDLAYRLKPSTWFYGGWHILTYVIGNFTFVFLLLGALRLRRTAPAWLWALAAGAATLVFTSVIMFRGHTQYFFIISPPIALLCARAMEEIEPFLWRTLRAGPAWRCFLLLVTAAFSLGQCAQVIHFNTYFDTYPEDVAHTLKLHTAPTDKLVVFGQTWGEPFMRAQRQGLTGGFAFQEAAWLNDTNKLARLKQLGYNKLVLINPSPMTVALTLVTGSHLSQTRELPQLLPDIAKNWPVVFSSASVLIVQIP
jgi:4-amino-4-deoxy-L-arabinose transferase-like glycosyltransferase